MISTCLKHGSRRRIVAVFSYRHDVHLTPALIENIAPLVDGWVSFDDRGSRELFSNELHRRSLLLRTALELGASWALAVDPDERFEAALADHMETLLGNAEADVYSFALREMYSPQHYRVDGIWGAKRQSRLLSLRKGLATPGGHLHTQWSDFVPSPRIVDTDFNIYHLKMMTPERRRARARLYSALDPGRQHQSIGYDYLADDRALELAAIAAGREYHPAHVEDGGLWMSDCETLDH